MASKKKQVSSSSSSSSSSSDSSSKKSSSSSSSSEPKKVAAPAKKEVKKSSSSSSSSEKKPVEKKSKKAAAKKSSSSSSSSGSSSSSSESEKKAPAKKAAAKKSSSSSDESSEATKADTPSKSKKRARESSETDAEAKAEEQSPPAKKPFDKGKNDKANEIFVGSLPFGTTEDDLRTLFSEEGATITRVGLINNGGCAFIAFATPEEAQAQLKWDGSKYSGRPMRVNMAGDKPAPGQKREQGGKREDDKDRTLFIGGLPFGTTEDEMKELFKDEGTVARVNMINDGGCAFVAFSTKDEATANLKWHESKYNGRALRVNFAGDKPARK